LQRSPLPPTSATRIVASPPQASPRLWAWAAAVGRGSSEGGGHRRADGSRKPTKKPYPYQLRSAAACVAAHWTRLPLPPRLPICSRHEHAADHGSTAPSRKSDRKPNRSFPDSATLATAMASVAAASAPSFSGGRGSAGAVQKLWSEVDEVALLTGAAAFKDRTGIASRLQGPLGMGGGGWTRVERGRRGLRWTSVGGFSLGRGAVERAVDLESSGGVCDERWWRKDGWTM
jgi:hypothetical protein